MKTALIVGATGMVGNHILDYCLESEEISKVKVLTRRPTGKSHSKLEEIIHKEFSSYEGAGSTFENVDMGFFCIGVYTGSVKDDLLREITVDYAEAFAKSLINGSPESTLCFLSGQGSDRTEKSRMSFAKYKGMAENLIDKMGFKAWYSFRPAYIYPVVPREEPNWMYSLSRKIYPIVKLMGKNASVKSSELAEAMLKVGLEGHEKTILENKDIVSVIQ
ncbi:MAG: NAD-dependent epimerase/dehydratase family protein [Bacteroidota bacterium]